MSPNPQATTSERVIALRLIQRSSYENSCGWGFPDISDEELDGAIALHHETGLDYCDAYREYNFRKSIREEGQKRGLSEDEVR
jgi:hypothetical protein